MTVPGIPPAAWDQLTDRQRDVARLLAEDDGVRRIARRLNIDPSTVRGHIHAIHRTIARHTTQEPPG